MLRGGRAALGQTPFGMVGTEKCGVLGSGSSRLVAGEAVLGEMLLCLWALVCKSGEG